MWRVGSILSTKKREKSLLSLAIPLFFFVGRQDAKILNLGKKLGKKNTGDNCQQQPGELKINKIRETKIIVSILSNHSSKGRKTLLRI
jgi:hypothetical protein